MLQLSFLYTLHETLLDSILVHFIQFEASHFTNPKPCSHNYENEMLISCPDGFLLLKHKVKETYARELASAGWQCRLFISPHNNKVIHNYFLSFTWSIRWWHLNYFRLLKTSFVCPCTSISFAIFLFCSLTYSPCFCLLHYFIVSYYNYMVHPLIGSYVAHMCHKREERISHLWWPRYVGGGEITLRKIGEMYGNIVIQKGKAISKLSYIHPGHRAV